MKEKYILLLLEPGEDYCFKWSGREDLNLRPPAPIRFGNNPHHKQTLTKEQMKEKGDRLRTSLSHDERSKKVTEFAFN